ncbi:MAG: sulfite exporter TauE/SafE family protein [Planctomycetota bacterium]|nr:sulfite exporter TauE/SafE family protein [Planctomycetota bacterium]
MIWAWLGAATVGLSLGLLGSGGAILTVPILVYLVGHSEKSAIAESLAIVAVIAFVGVLRAALQKRVDFRSAALLAVPGILGTFLGAAAAKHISGAVQLVLLALLMLTSAVLMFRSGRSHPPPSPPPTAPPDAPSTPRALAVIAAQGVGLGLATGLVGVGGGFLIVPVLVLLRRLAMPTAIGTSLAIIAVNSTTGFLKYLAVLSSPGVQHDAHISWHTIGIFAALGIAGSLLGNFLAGRIYQNTLKRIFALFLVLMAAYILVRQAPRVFPDLFHPPPASISK